MATTREIKFRTWSWGTMKYFNKPEDFKWFFGGTDGPERLLTDCGLMQYTGRKGRDGVEIYEDDIVIDEEGRYGLVYWNPEESHFLVDFQSDMDIEEISFYHTVCGNRWQNVELLK